MKINPRYRHILSKVLQEGTEKKTAANELCEEKKIQEGEKFIPSRLAELISHISTEVEGEEVSEKRAAELAALTEQIKKGEYRCDSRRIAEAMFVECSEEENER